MILIACIIALIALTSTAQGQNDTSRPSCDGYCLNGGRCPTTRSVRVLRCRCPRGYIGNRCETRRVPCPEIDPRPSGKCKGKLCSDDRSCVKRGEQCCHSSCGRKLCTNINGPGQQQNMTSPRIRTNPERRKNKNLNKDGMTEERKNEKVIYPAANGRYEVEEDPNSPSCKGLCLNGGQCVRNFPGNALGCNCHIRYTGKRCENSRYSCPNIYFPLDGECEERICLNELDCINPGEQCCPSTCGKKLCTKIKATIFNYPCRLNDFCFHGGRCWISFQGDRNCICPIGYHGIRCEERNRQ